MKTLPTTVKFYLVFVWVLTLLVFIYINSNLAVNVSDIGIALIFLAVFIASDYFVVRFHIGENNYVSISLSESIMIF